MKYAYNKVKTIKEDKTMEILNRLAKDLDDRLKTYRHFKSLGWHDRKRGYLNQYWWYHEHHEVRKGYRDGWESVK